MKPRAPIPRWASFLLGATAILLVLALWYAAANLGWAPAGLLADPIATLRSALDMGAAGFALDLGATVARVAAGFLLAVLVGLPLGLWMGAYTPMMAFFEPLFVALRYLPATAFIPYTLLWSGQGDGGKVAVVFLGAVFTLTLLVARAIRLVRRELVEAAYTLGVPDRRILRRVLLPAAAPTIAEALRTVLRQAWVFVIAAEVYGTATGIGRVLSATDRGAGAERSLAAILAVGFVAFVFDMFLRTARRQLFAWSPR